MKKILTTPAMLGRRRFLGTLSAGTAAAALLPSTVWAQSKTIFVSNWGGDWNERTVKFMEKPLLEDQGFRIVHDLGMESERKTKLISELRVRRASSDVIHLNSSDAFELKQHGVVSDLDLSQIPNYADVSPGLREDYFVPWLYSGVVIIYNKDKISDPPKSYADLWDPKWAGRIGLTTQLYFNYMLMAGLVAKGNMTSVEEGKQLIEQLIAENKPKLYAAHQQLQTGLANGEVDIAVNYKARGLQWAQDGQPLQIQFPEDGAIRVIFGACLTKFAQNPENGYAYLNAMLDPAAMGNLSEASLYAPANTKAVMSDDIREKIDFTPDQQDKMHALDYEYVAANTSAWLEWWNKAFAG